VEHQAFDAEVEVSDEADFTHDDFCWPQRTKDAKKEKNYSLQGPQRSQRET
jgi:hypothetical protein